MNLDLDHILTKSTLKFSHDLLPIRPTAAHVDLYLHPQVIYNQPLPMPYFDIIAETLKIFRFQRIETDDMKNEIILETERNINMPF